MAYKRGDEGPASIFYKAYASYYPETPAGIKKFVDGIEKKTGLARRGVSTWPTDLDTVASTAQVFAELADLDLDRDDATQLDTFALGLLVDPRVREAMEDEEEYERIQEAEENRIADEPLLHYAMGCFWGEWMVRHTDSRWCLYAPLDPVQSFPDMLATGSMTAVSPFSLVTKMIANPAGDALADKIAIMPEQVMFGPVALCATISDSEQILADFVGPEMVAIGEQLARGETDAGFAALEDAIDADPENGHLLQRAAMLGWQHEELAIVHRATFLQLKIAPERAEIRHNFAAIESMREGGLEGAIDMLEELVAEQPEYAQAHLTLGSCYREANRTEDARAQVDWLLEHAPDMAEEARTLAAELH